MDVEAFLRAARGLARDASRTARTLRLSRGQVLYNVHTYAWPCYEAFVRRYHASCDGPVVGVAMNPGKYGAVQTGIPFTDFVRAEEMLPGFPDLRRQPKMRLPKPGREQSGRRVYAWGLRRFGTPERFLHEVVFLITCPLAVLDWRGNRAVNVPLPGLRRQDRERIVAMMHRHVPRLLAAIEPHGVLLLGNWARDTWIETDLPTARGPHPAAHMRDADWIATLDETWDSLGAG